MMKPEVKFEQGMLLVSAGYAVDADADGKPSAELALQAKLNAAEVVSEIAKKDLPWLEAILAQIKAI